MHDENPAVSVIVPIYNTERYLRECLDSILDQTCSEYEVICLDNCSTDGSGTIIDEYAKRYPCVTAIHNERNLGPGGNRNKGIRLAKGDFIIIIDSDDYIGPDYIKTYLSAMREQPADIIIGSFRRVVNGKVGRPQVISNSVWSLLSYGVPWGRIYRRDLFKKGLRFSDGAFGEDISLNLSAFFDGATYRVIQYDNYYFRINASSTTKSEAFREGVERNIVEMFDRFFCLHPYEEMEQDQKWIIQYLFISNLVMALSFYRGQGMRRMREVREYVFDQIEVHFPDYKKNPYVGLFKPKGQRAHIRVSVGLAMRLHELKLDGIAWGLYSII